MFVGGGVLCHGVRDVIIESLQTRNSKVQMSSFVNDLSAGGCVCFFVVRASSCLVSRVSCHSLTHSLTHVFRTVARGGVAMLKIREASQRDASVDLVVAPSLLSRDIGRSVTSMSYGFVYLDARNVPRVKVSEPALSRMLHSCGSENVPYERCCLCCCMHRSSFLRTRGSP
jgi:hypothetical protein